MLVEGEHESALLSCAVECHPRWFGGVARCSVEPARWVGHAVETPRSGKTHRVERRSTAFGTPS
jgi:hypothetical protein